MWRSLLDEAQGLLRAGVHRITNRGHELGGGCRQDDLDAVIIGKLEYVRSCRNAEPVRFTCRRIDSYLHTC
ncbi:MAG: hypothetical protein QOE41_4722 [Mycobacterium sp.]|jgi:hypothetical protein|nr:hypothetical protein [Mycobacterium sp.]MDT5135411.1 hypothetical protein [Mycobacterium sp.]